MSCVDISFYFIILSPSVLSSFVIMRTRTYHCIAKDNKLQLTLGMLLQFGTSYPLKGDTRVMGLRMRVTAAEHLHVDRRKCCIYQKHANVEQANVE